jgi:hypothetical protein
VVSISWPAVNGTKGGQHRQSSPFFSYKISMPKVRLGDSSWPEYGPMTGCMEKTQTYCDLRLMVSVSSAVTNNYPERPENGAHKPPNAS